MAIKKRIHFVILVIIIFTLLAIFPYVKRNEEKQLIFPEHHQIKTPFSQSVKLVDKVYTFTPPESSYIVDLNLQGEYKYSIETTIVTPHDCCMKITVWDPTNRKFQLFYRNISQADGVMYAPFGVAQAGNHTFLFQVITNMNINIQIKIIQEDIKCLYDKIPLGDHGNIIFYEVSPFENGTTMEHYVNFLSDFKYTCYIGRVSAISLNQSNLADVSYNIIDPFNINFVIYSNDTLASIAEVNKFSFGTAVEGLYKIEITIHCEVNWVNVGYAIIDAGPISQQIDPNQTENNDSTPLGSDFSIPFDFALYTILFGGVITGGIVAFVVIHRRRTSVNLEIENQL